MAMADRHSTKASLEAFRDLGLQVSIDDFGTGYSSLAYLHTLPVSTVKVDRSFIERLDAPEGSMPVVSAILDLSHAMGLRVVAEGVSTAAAPRDRGVDGLRVRPGVPLERAARRRRVRALVERRERTASGAGGARGRAELRAALSLRLPRLGPDAAGPSMPIVAATRSQTTRKNASPSSTEPTRWPNSSKLTNPKSSTHAMIPFATTSGGRPISGSTDLGEARGPRPRSTPTAATAARPASQASRRIAARARGTRDGGADRVLRGDVAGDR